METHGSKKSIGIIWIKVERLYHIRVQSHWRECSHGDEAELRCGQNMLIVPSLLTEALIPKLLIMSGWVYFAQHADTP